MRTDVECAFLTKQNVLSTGGDHVVYRQGDVVETYSVPEEMLAKLPEECPTHVYRTCAVVGNSGSLRYADPPLGMEIERHEMVYRFNRASHASTRVFLAIVVSLLLTSVSARTGTCATCSSKRLPRPSSGRG